MTNVAGAEKEPSEELRKNDNGIIIMKKLRTTFK